MARIVQASLCFLMPFAGLAPIARSQAAVPSSLDGVYTPPGLERGTPAHSYALSGFDNVSYFNGNLNFHLPLLQIGGRGQAAYTLTLPIESRFELFSATTGGAGFNTFNPQYFDVYNTSNTNALYTPGVVFARVTGSQEDVFCTLSDGSTAQYSTSAVTRLTFVEPDGSRHELLDVRTNGLPYAVSCPVSPPPSGFDRGKVFVTQDSSALKFVATQDVLDPYSFVPGTYNTCVSGTLYFPDGRAYAVNTSCEVTQIRDRNGSIVTLSHTGSIGAAGASLQIVDSAGRHITVTSSGTQDVIQYPGFNGVNPPRTITVNYTSLGNALRADYGTGPQVQCAGGVTGPPGIQTLSGLFPESGLSMPQCHNPTVVANVVLANKQTYQFHYNPFGELARVDLPTGGAYEYDVSSALSGTSSGAIGVHGKAANDPSDPANDIAPFMLYRRVIERRVYKAPGALEGKIDVSIPPFAPGTGDTVTTVTAYDSGGTALSTETHSFYALPTTELYCQDGSNPCYLQDEFYPSWQEGKEFETDYLQVGSTTVLRKLRHSWFNAAASSSPKAAVDPPLATDPSLDPHLLQTDTTLDTGVVGRQSFAYDAFNNLTDSSDYDYSSTPPGPPLRHVHTDYVQDTNYTSGPIVTGGITTAVYLPSLPILQRTDLGTSTTIYSQTQYQYDNYGASAACPDSSAVPVLNAPQTGPLCTHANIVQMDPAYVSGGVTQRGNATRVQRTGSPSPDVFTYRQYDVAGNVVRKIDANGNQTQLDYDSNSNTYAFLSRLTDALGHSTTLTWDLNTGKPTNIKDPNQQPTGFDYTDLLDRLKTITRPDGSKTVYGYLDSTNTVSTTSDVTSSIDSSCTAKVQVYSDIVYDGLGRPSMTHLSDPVGQIMTQTAYDGKGRTYQVSNPYRASDTIHNTTTIYDSLDRLKNITEADGMSLTSFAYSGNQTTVTDPASHPWTLVSDALGRLTKVIEPNGTQTGYVYDPAGMLRYANHNGTVDSSGNCTGCQQQRSFVYDDLQRLTSATSPENGQVTYNYDAQGNLMSKIMGGITTSYLPYDGLNRVKGKSYSDNKTFSVAYSYDTSPNGIGRLASISATDPLTSNKYITSFDSYDSMGHVLQSTQTTPGSAGFPYVFHYTYNLAGQLETITYPSQRTISACYNTADRPQSVSNGVSLTTATPYATVNQYAPHGVIQKMTMGNNLVETTGFNARLQPIGTQAGTSTAPASLLALGYSYCSSPSVTDCSGNNGNMLWQTINDGATTRTDAFTYDSLNRLITATESPTWTQTYVYDKVGNRALLSSSNDPSVGVDQILRIVTTDPNSVPFDHATNRWTFPGAKYDNGSAGGPGNLTESQLDANNSFHAVYDAENRQTSTTVTLTGSSPSTINYVYDGDGRRVLKVTGTATTTYVYDAQGNLAVEYSTATNPDTGRHYLTVDHLGSTRLDTQAVANAPHVFSRSDYLPFGQEIPTTWNRSNYQPDPSQPLKFTGKERDSETGLDYFGARYFSAAQGRFTSPDPIQILPQKLLDPQQWNMYAYVRNNPLRLVDPTGMYVTNCAEDDKACNKRIDKFEKARQKDLKSKNEAVRDAAAQYGDRGIDNGVTVQVLTPQQMIANPDIGQVVNGATQPVQGQDEDRVNIFINSELGGKDLQRTIAHEGTHLGMDLDFINGFNPDTGRYDPSLNFTHGQTEFISFMTGAAVKKYNYPNVPCGGAAGCQFGPQDANKINQFLHNHPQYGPIYNLPVFSPGVWKQ